MSVRGGRRHHEPKYGTVQLHRQEAAFDDEGGGRLGAGERGRDGMNSLCATTFVLQVSTASCEDRLVFGKRENGNRPEGGGNESTCERAG